MYGKLFVQMYDGTLGTEGPWQALIAFQQLIILADQEGVVDMTPEAISRRTTIPLDILQIGLAALEQPDPSSRSPEEEGRRIVRLSETRDWGWRLVNHAKYRAIRTTEERRQYHREYWHKRKAASTVPTDSTRTQQNQPIAEAEAEAEAERKKQPSSPRGDDVRFEAFWKAYPRKVGKGASLKAWQKIKPTPELAERILAAVAAQKRGEQWQRDGGQYIPHPTTWLNSGRWDDEAVVDLPRPVRKVAI